MAEKPTYEELEKRIQELEQAESERERIEEELRESQTRFQLFFEVATLGYQSLDEDGNIVDVNPAWLDFFGYSREEVIGKSFSEFLHPDWKNHFKESFARFKDVGEILGVEFEMIKKDSSFIIVSLNGKIAKDKYGGFKQTHFILQDFTERKRMKKTLKKEIDRSQQYLDVAGVLIVVIDIEQNVSMINKKGCEILGYEEYEIVGKNWFDHFIEGEDREEIKEVFNQIISGDIEPVKYYENAVLTKGGGEKILIWHNSVIRDESGRIIGTLSSGDDITERKKAEEALKKSEEWHRNFLENLSDVVFESDDSGNITYANKIAESITGLPLKDIIGKPFLPFFDKKSQEIAADVYLRTLNGESPECELALNNGKIIHFKNKPLRNKDGKIIGIFGIARDVTDSKIAE